MSYSSTLREPIQRVGAAAEIFFQPFGNRTRELWVYGGTDVQKERFEAAYGVGWSRSLPSNVVRALYESMAQGVIASETRRGWATTLLGMLESAVLDTQTGLYVLSGTTVANPVFDQHPQVLIEFDQRSLRQ
jgi:hypothetical protein